MQNLLKIQSQIEWVATNFERIEHQTCLINQITLQNNKMIFPIVRKIFSTNLIPLHIILTMLSDVDIFNVASTCKTLNKIIFSPFGFRLLKTLRPLVVEIVKNQDQPLLNIGMYNINNDKMERAFESDDDDLEAVIYSMHTNNLAIMHKIKEIEKATKNYNVKSKILMSTLNDEAKLKENYMQKNNVREDKLEKLQSISKNSEQNIKQLISEQNRLYSDKLNKIQNLQKQREKLQSQKQLLIKKIKTLTKQAEEQQSMSQEVKSIIKKIDSIIKKK